MKQSIRSFLIVAPFVTACAGSFPPPTQRLAEAQSAERSARELGASSEPAAKLSLKLAQEQISEAQKFMADGENERAHSLLIRARADAELALAQTREKGALAGVADAVEDSAEQRTTNIGQGAVK